MDAKEALVKGDEAYDRGELAEAVEHYTKAIFHDYKLLTAYYNRAAALMELGHYKRAAEDLLFYLNKKEDPEGWLNLGVCMLNLNNFEEAVSSLRNTLELGGDWSETHYNLGIALHHLGEIEQAIEEFRFAMSKGEDVDVIYHLANAHADIGNYHEALALYKKILQMNPSDKLRQDVWFNLANTLHDLKRYKDAEHEFRKLIEMFPHNYRAIFNLAYLLEKTNPEEAVNLYLKTLSLKNLHQAHYNIACVLSRLGRVEDADIHLKKAIELAPEEGYEMLSDKDPDLKNWREKLYT